MTITLSEFDSLIIDENIQQIKNYPILEAWGNNQIILLSEVEGSNYLIDLYGNGNHEKTALTIENSGRISGTGTIIKLSGSSFHEIYNYGYISGGYLIENYGTSFKFENYGDLVSDSNAFHLNVGWDENPINFENHGLVNARTGALVFASSNNIYHPVKIMNSGQFNATETLITASGSDKYASFEIQNSGIMSSGGVALDAALIGTDIIENSGKIVGDIFFYYGDDSLISSSQSELIGTVYGGFGDDFISGGLSDDIFYGDNGKDTITGGAGNDTLNGGAGNDTLDGGEGDDEIYGGDGDDIIYTSAGNDIYDGGDGIDTVITDYINSPPTVGGSISLRNIENQFFIGETNIMIDRSLDPESGNNHVKSESGDDRILLGVGDDTFELGAGKNFSGGGAGNDTIILSSDNKFTSSYLAKNISSSLQTGTEERINLNGKTRFEDVMYGGADLDTVGLTDASDAFFLHDSFSGFHSSLSLSDDYAGSLGTARIENIEIINADAGDDVIDLTSPDYSLAGQNIIVDGGEGDDTLWGSDANETLKGGNGDDVLFGGVGINTITGGTGADEFQFTRTSIADTVTDYDLSSGDKLTFFYEAGSEEAEWSFSIQNGDLRWGYNTIDFGTTEVTALRELSIFVEEIGSGQAKQFVYVPTLGEEILRLDLYPALYEQDYYSKLDTDLQFAEFNNLATAIDAEMNFLDGLNTVAVATGLQADGNGFGYSAGALYNNVYNTIEISADISNFKIDGVEANPASLQALLQASNVAPGKVGGLFNSITLSANSTDYLTLKHSANGLSLVYDNARNGMINELRLDGSFDNDLNRVIPVLSNLLAYDFSDPISLLGSQEFLDTSVALESVATVSGLSILQKGVAEPYLQLSATDTTLNVAYKNWDIVGVIEVAETWQPDTDAFLTALQNLVTNSNELDLSELSSLYQGAGSLSLSILHDDAGKVAEGIIHDFGELMGILDQQVGDQFIFGTAAGDSYVIDSAGLAAVVFKDREFNEPQISELNYKLGIWLDNEVSSSSTTTIPAASTVVTASTSAAAAVADIEASTVINSTEEFDPTIDILIFA